MAVQPRSRLLALALAAAVAAGSAAAVEGVLPARATSVPTASEDAGAPGANAPACTTGDTLTRYRAVGDWYRTILDRRYRLSSRYAPRDLVSVSNAGVAGSGRIRRIAIGDFRIMAKAARAAGASFAVQSAYRSYATQVSTFWSWVRRSGYRAALLSSARGGHSEHQLGTAVDLRTPGGPAPWYAGDWGTSRAGTWLRKHSWQYGWILSYPKARSPQRTCYKYEPWHFRYFGRLIAARIHASGLSPREWLWRRGAMGTWTGGSPVPTPTPSPSPTPTPSPTTKPTATPTDSPTPRPTSEPTATPDPTPDPTPEPAPTATPSPSPAPSPSPSPDPTSRPAPTDAPTDAP